MPSPNMTRVPLSLPFVATTLSLVFLFGVTVLLTQMMQVQEFLVEQFSRTSEEVAYMREKMTDLKVEVAQQQGTITALQVQLDTYGAPPVEQP